MTVNPLVIPEKFKTLKLSASTHDDFEDQPMEVCNTIDHDFVASHVEEIKSNSKQIHPCVV